jgi:hypothetical protein
LYKKGIMKKKNDSFHQLTRIGDKKCLLTPILSSKEEREKIGDAGSWPQSASRDVEALPELFSCMITVF